LNRVKYLQCLPPPISINTCFLRLWSPPSPFSILAVVAFVFLVAYIILYQDPGEIFSVLLVWAFVASFFGFITTAGVQFMQYCNRHEPKKVKQLLINRNGTELKLTLQGELLGVYLGLKSFLAYAYYWALVVFYFLTRYFPFSYLGRRSIHHYKHRQEAKYHKPMFFAFSNHRLNLYLHFVDREEEMIIYIYRFECTPKKKCRLCRKTINQDKLTKIITKALKTVGAQNAFVHFDPKDKHGVKIIVNLS
jgi:hypothetical protein